VLLEYRTPQPRQINPLVIARLVAVGARVVSVTGEARTLEDVYAAAVSQNETAGAIAPGR
jgi:hypothetical protein